MKIKILLNILFYFVSITLLAHKASDSTSIIQTHSGIQTHSKFHTKQIIVPASLVIVGSWGINNNWFQNVNHSARHHIATLRDTHFFHGDDYIQYLPVISNLGLGLLGVDVAHSFKERVVITLTSYLTMGIMVNTIKSTTKVKRPDSFARNSFPSGHTATVFMGAELVRKEYGPGYGIGAYTMACGVAFLRIYNDRHWLNDVLAGAGIGILSAQISYWLLPVNQKIFNLDHTNKSIIMASPFYDHKSRATGGSLAINF